MRSIKEMDKRLDEREQEIERLQQENKQLKEQLEDTTTELFRANKKISEAIEYIKECEYHLVIQPQKLLEILGDKE